MPVAAALERLRPIVAKFGGKHELAELRNAYGGVLHDAQRLGQIDKSHAELLSKARVELEAWWKTPRPDPITIWDQWLEIDAWTADWLPTGVSQSFLSRLPKMSLPASAWIPIALERRDQRVLKAILRRKLVKPKDMARLSAERAVDFFASPLPDVLVEEGVSLPRATWQPLTTGTTRPADVRGAEDLFAAAFALDKSPDAVPWLVSFLEEHEALRRSLLPALVRDVRTIARVAAYLGFGKLLGLKSKRRSSPLERAALVIDLLEATQRIAAVDHEQSVGESVTIATLHLGRLIDPKSLSLEAAAQLELAMEVSGRAAVVKTLRQVEDGNLEGANRDAIVVSGTALFEGVQSYLKALAVGHAGSEESADRALRQARYSGRRDVIQPLLSIFADAPEGSGPLRDALAAALFNAGVRERDTGGESTTFDPDLHEAEEGGILPGEPVVVTRQGFVIGEGEAALVLRKAGVRKSV